MVCHCHSMHCLSRWGSTGSFCILYVAFACGDVSTDLQAWAYLQAGHSHDIDLRGSQRLPVYNLKQLQLSS